MRQKIVALINVFLITNISYEYKASKIHDISGKRGN